VANFYVEQITRYILFDHSDSPISVLTHPHFWVYGKHLPQQLHRRALVTRQCSELGKIWKELLKIADSPILKRA
jgi:hypothetical protein